jgi:hypothetical protein
MRSTAIFVAVSAMTLSGSALANPVMAVNDAYVEQFPGTAHVQLTRNYNGGGVALPPQGTRDGAVIEVTFENTPGEIRDWGSGISSPLYTGVSCDCFVPVGHHVYTVAGQKAQLDVVEASAATGSVRSPSAACDTKCGAASPATAASSGTKSDDGSSGCSVSRATCSLWPISGLAAFGLLVLRRRK